MRPSTRANGNHPVVNVFRLFDFSGETIGKDLTYCYGYFPTNLSVLDTAESQRNNVPEDKRICSIYDFKYESVPSYVALKEDDEVLKLNDHRPSPPGSDGEAFHSDAKYVPYDVVILNPDKQFENDG